MKFKSLLVGAVLATTAVTFGAVPIAQSSGTADDSVVAAYALENETENQADNAGTGDAAIHTETETEAVSDETADADVDAVEGDFDAATGDEASNESVDEAVTPDETVTAPVEESAPAAAAEDAEEAEEVKVEYAKPSIALDSHVQNIGWKSAGTLVPGKSVVLGTSGKGLRLEAFKLAVSYPGKTDGQVQPTGDLEVDSYIQGTRWQGWKTSGNVSGTVGQAKRIEAIRMRLTGELADQYDIYYRVHVQNVGWMPWAKNGSVAGTYGKDLRVEAVEVMLVEKNASNAPATGQSLQGSSGLKDRAHVQNIGWQGWTGSGSVIGTSGKALRIEALQLNLVGYEQTGGIRYRAHVQNIGWQGWASNGSTAGTTGRALRMEAIQIELTGDIANSYDIYYRVHVQNIGWMPWTKNGGYAGTEGYALRMEAVEIRLVKKGDAAPSTGAAFLGPASVSTRGYVKDSGWQGWSASTAGTTGKSKALTAIEFTLSGDNRPSGNVTYRAYNGSWTGWASNGALAGTENGAKLQAVQLKLEGDMASRYDIYYRAHVSSIGWLGWAKNGASAGTSISGYQLEAVEVKLVRKGGAAPGSTSGAYFDGNTAKIGWQNPSGYYQVSRFNVTLPAAAYNTPFSYVTPSRIGLTASRQDCINAFVQRAYEYVGTPYVWNYSRQVGVGVDCIGLVYQCAYATGMDMGEFNPYNHYYSGTNGWHSHDAMNVWNYGKIQRLSFSQRQYGDLIFYPGHVGIYIGNNKIIEASSISGKVVISSVYRYSTIYGVGRLYV